MTATCFRPRPSLARRADRSCVPYPLVLWLKKVGQQAIDAQQTIERQLNPIAVERRIAFIGQLAPHIAPLFHNLYAELLSEVTGVEPAFLEVEDQLADQ